MPLVVIKKSLKYCFSNKPFLVFLLVLFFIWSYLDDLTSLTFVGPYLLGMLLTGYGLQVTENIIHGGTSPPKILPKKVIVLGFKGYVISFAYMVIQVLPLAIVSLFLNFPTFEIEELLLKPDETLNLFLTHDPLSGFIFIVSGFLIVYVTTFFMEIALARLADGGKLKNAFDLSRIKHVIDVIGWKSYAIRYTRIIIAIVLLSYLIYYRATFPLLDMVIDSFLYFLMFVIEFLGMGHIYKVYIDNKPQD